MALTVRGGKAYETTPDVQVTKTELQRRVQGLTRQINDIDARITELENDKARLQAEIATVNGIINQI